MTTDSPFTDDQLAAAIADYFRRGVQDGRITGGADRRAITELAFIAAYGVDVRLWPADWQAQWAIVERRLAGKRLQITVSFESEETT